MARIPHNIDIALSSRRGAPRYVGYDGFGQRYRIHQDRERGAWVARCELSHFCWAARTLTLLGDKLARIAPKKDIAQ